MRYFLRLAAVTASFAAVATCALILLFEGRAPEPSNTKGTPDEGCCPAAKQLSPEEKPFDDAPITLWFNGLPVERLPDPYAELPPSNVKLPEKFTFKECEASLSYSVSQYKSDTTFTINEISYGNIMLIFVRDGEEIMALRGHRNSVFRSDGNRLFFAHFGPRMDGCLVYCYDLDDGKTVWQRRLRAVGMNPHSAYRNRVTIDLSADHVTITGNESYGDYIEVLDRQTGSVLAHRIYRNIYLEPSTPSKNVIPTIIVPVPTPARR